MPRIVEDTGLCTVIVTVDAPPALLEEMVAHARAGIRRFAEYPGYAGGALHVSDDGGRLIQYLQWRSRSEYEACIEDPAWDDLESTAPFLDAVRSGRAKLDARVYDVVATFEGGAAG